MKLSIKSLLPILVGIIVALLPCPHGLPPNAWNYFAIFAGVVVGLIIEPIPAAAVGLIGVILAAALRLVPNAAGKDPSVGEAANWALSGFSDSTVWLIFVAFMFALGYERSGLGKRIALTLIKYMGKSTLGLGYAVAFADLALAPFMPSNTARSGGTIFPIIKNIPPLFGSTPEKDARKIGSYLMWVALAVTCVTSSMFFTGLAPNLLAKTLVEKTAKLTFSWSQWYLGFLPVGVILFLAIPILTYVIYPPTLKKSEDAPIWASAELLKLGKITLKEITMASLAIFALLMWIFAGDYLNATTVALIALSLMIIFNVITWDELLSNKQAWNILMWFGTLVALADGLNKTGFLKWIAALVAGSLGGMSVTMIMVGFTTFFFFVHYFFASLTAHTTALLPVLLTAAMAVPGMDMPKMSLMLCYTLGLMGIITPYATGPSPIYYGSGYISRRDFWLLGMVFGIVFIGVFLGVGIPWLLYF